MKWVTTSWTYSKSLWQLSKLLFFSLLPFPLVLSVNFFCFGKIYLNYDGKYDLTKNRYYSNNVANYYRFIFLHKPK